MHLNISFSPTMVAVKIWINIVDYATLNMRIAISKHPVLTKLK